YSNLAIDRGGIIEKWGISFDQNEISSAEGRETMLSAIGAEGDTLALVTTLANSGEVTDGTSVAKVIIQATNGRAIERDLRAGIATAEWSYEHQYVRPHIHHSLATVFDSRPGDGQASFQAHRYLSRIPLEQRCGVESVKIIRPEIGPGLTVWKGT